MHGKEGDIETDDRQSEIPLAHTFIHQPASHFGKPIVNCTQQGKHRATDEHIVQMGHYKIAVVGLGIKWYRRHHYARNSANDECKNKSQYIKQWSFEIQFSVPKRG